MEYVLNRDEKKQLYKTLGLLAVPVMVQNFLTTALNLIDTLMIGKVSADSSAAIAAVGYANQIYFAVSLFIVGFTGASQVYAAQYYGKGDYNGVRRALGLGLISCGGFCLLCQLAASFWPGQLISLFTNDQEVIRLGGSYLSIVAWSYFITGITFVYSAVLRSMRAVRLPVIVAVVGIVVNTALNYILIYGKLGFKAMGVDGAAWATLIARILQLVIILLAVYLPKTELACGVRKLFSISRSFLKDYVRTAAPIIINEGLWGVGTSLYTVYYGHISTSAGAAAQVASNVEKFAWIIIGSVGTVAAIVLGNELGCGNKQKAFAQAKQMNKLMLLFAAVLMVIMCAVAPWFPNIVDVGEDTARTCSLLILILACVTPFKAMNYNTNIGILRSGGDTTFCCVLESCLIWLVSVPLGFLFYKLGWGILPVFMIVHIDEIIKLPILLRRYKKGIWLDKINIGGENGEGAIEKA